jgi:carbonic anhydrase/acetyltransferase-like protein (isoleucine patch superfamily)
MVNQAKLFNIEGIRMNVYDLGAASATLPDDGEYWIAPNAVVIGNVIFKKNASIWFSSVARGDNEAIVIGENSNVQDGSVLHTDRGHPLSIGANVTIGHMVMLHGCEIGDGSLIGLGSVVMNGARIGRNCLIGARTLITEGKVIPDNAMVLGSPGKVVRELTEDEVRGNLKSASSYVENWKRFRQGLKLRA